MKVKRALISVWDKTGLEGFVKNLSELGIEIMSTGGTAKEISSFGVPVIEVSSYTGFPEMLDGRVKTLHPKIHAGFLAVRDNAEHMKQLKESGIFAIDMVVVNLYPFEKTIARDGVTLEEAIENIDIGGPTMMRSAAKNYKSVAVVSSPLQYQEVLKELKDNECSLSEPVLEELAVEVFAKTSKYDAAITNYLSGKKEPERESEDFLETFNINMRKIKQLRYGENPHQRAALYWNAFDTNIGLSNAEQLHGKELSFNNILDINAALQIVKDFEDPAACVVKHNNPCGAATAVDLKDAYLNALDCDRMSAFGGIMGFNKPINEDLAKTILNEADFIECIIAPEYENDALEVFKTKKNLRVLRVPESVWFSPKEKDLKKIPGGALLQDADSIVLSLKDIKIVTKNKPSDKMLKSLIFGWKVSKYVKSNAIVLANDTKTVGIGAGQMSRVDSVIIAIRKAGEKVKGSILASDGFFPKADSIEEAHKAGVTAIIQPGGSIRDEEVIKACDEFGIPMVVTGIRHFKH